MKKLLTISLVAMMAMGFMILAAPVVNAMAYDIAAEQTYQDNTASGAADVESSPGVYPDTSAEAETPADSGTVYTSPDYASYYAQYPAVAPYPEFCYPYYPWRLGWYGTYCPYPYGPVFVPRVIRDRHRDRDHDRDHDRFFSHGGPFMRHFPGRTAAFQGRPAGPGFAPGFGHGAMGSHFRR